MKPIKKNNLEKRPEIMKNYDNEINQEIEDNQEKNFTLFMKMGIIVLSIIAIIGFGIKILPNAVTVSSAGNKRELPIYCVNTEEKKVSLSFDMAWGNEDTQRILDILAKHKIKASFFMTGDWVSQYPEGVKAIATAGHDLGNHSENHKQMTQLSTEECIKEIMQVHKRVKNLTNVEMTLFRPPYGDYNNTLIGAARDCGYDTIQWDVDVYATTLKPVNTRA